MIIRLLLLYLFCGISVAAQEKVAPLDHNVAGSADHFFNKANYKTTAISLPFFEDFTDYEVFPNPERWADHDVYVNNTMGSGTISRGVATFDALNEYGGPYDSANFNTLRQADSLTSQPIDLSIYTPADSIYLSFYYQPQGLGFAPEKQDSLMLFLKRINSSWEKVWADTGGTVHPFIQVMVPVRDTAYFGADFQFRFINKASINLNDDVWNIDYIRMDAGRSMSDTALRDITTTTEASFLLNDYTVMPYSQFLINATAELEAQHSFTVKNNAASTENISYSYTAREAISNTPLTTGASSAATFAPYSEQIISFPMYSINYPNPGGRVVLEQQYVIKPAIAGNVAVNDTIRKQQIFDMYLAYDDGTAEKSYFLNQFATLPANLAIEYHLNAPDTIFGIAIYFGRQVPLAFNKFFSVQIYDDIAVNGGSDQLIYQQDLLFPGYADTVNKFWYYKFDSPVPMPAGAFFMGTQQPASSGSDSLYFGLDVNRIGGNHLYYNVQNFWESSLISGALMMRPLLSRTFTPSAISDAKKDADAMTISLYPNPARNEIYVRLPIQADQYNCQIVDMQGRVLISDNNKSGLPVNIEALQAGVYFVRILIDSRIVSTQKIIKL